MVKRFPQPYFTIAVVAAVVLIGAGALFLLEQPDRDSSPAPQEVALRVNDEEYTQGTLTRVAEALSNAQIYYCEQGLESDCEADTSQEAVDLLVRKTILEELADAYDVTVSDELVRSQALVFNQTVPYQDVYGEDGEIFFNFVIRPIVLYKELFQAISPSGKDPEALQKITAVRDRIVNRGFAFEEEARTYSDREAEAVLGGYYGLVGRSDIPGEIFDELYELSVGDVSEIYQVGNTFQIYQIDSKNQNTLKLGLKRIIIEMETLDTLIERHTEQANIVLNN